MLVGGRQARLPAKGTGDPKASAFGIALRTWGSRPRRPTRAYRYFYFLFPRLSASCRFQKRLAQSAMAEVRTLSGKPDERFAKKR
jgi:hypothetical protein